MTFCPLDTVALLRDRPEASLTQGQVGAVVERLLGGEYLVEFSDDNGRAYAIVPIAPSELLKLPFAALAAE